MRQSGILLHISSLPTEFGIGDFGPSAQRFSAYLKREGYSFWQILPINHCGYGNSPYNPISAFAISPYLISPELLFENGLVNRSSLEAAKLPMGDTVFYESVYKAKDKLLFTAANNWLIANDVDSFISSEGNRLKPYLAFQVLSRIYDDNAWYNWNEEHRCYSETLYQELWKHHATEMQLIAACQCIVRDQLQQFRNTLASDGLSLVGDMPLYLSYESAEVWANRQLFELDDNGLRLSFAGVPPDAFAAEGQLWGNPIYRWQEMQKDGFQLFFERIAAAMSYIDILRLDHFIGYVNYWRVPCTYNSSGMPLAPSSARDGAWIPALPWDFFEKLCQRFGKQHFIAEDLGILNEEVCRVRDHFGFPGMIVLQFCFEDSVPRVREFSADRWLYTGTHDNSTLKGWYQALPPDSPSIAHLHHYCQENSKRDCRQQISADNVSRIMRNIAAASSCERIIVPFQDILSFDDSARMNIPGTALGNWQWRIDTTVVLPF